MNSLGGVNRRRLLYALIAGLVPSFALLVWPTRYRYDHMSLGRGVSLLVRTDRLNGYADILYPSGWRQVRSERKLTPEELHGVDARFYLEGGLLSVVAYNGTNLAVREFTVRVTLWGVKGRPTLQRLYTTQEGILAYSTATLHIDLGQDVKPNFDPVAEARSRWPQLKNMPDSELIERLQDPTYFHAAFPQYAKPSPHTMEAMKEYLPGGKRFGYKPWTCEIVSAVGTPQ